MTLSTGTRLGPYEILSPLGAGGMGEVYRAKDLRIDRTVALKVLPEEFFENEERRARFGREARTLASLSHPGIALLYSFEEIPGPSSSSPGSSATRHLLVMELVEGEGLDQKIAAGPLPLEETVSYARQIAEALAAAHEKGIVHRDLKPANVMVMKDGRAKILDFGLAKVAGSGESAKADTTLPTDMKTREGVVMGTVPYMSPEQVSGRPLDHRTDIFSLGVILYEMATGRRPFQGDSSAELISSILRDTPRPPGELRKGLPVNLERIVQRCLEKSAADRVQSARQILDGLRGLTTEAPATPTAAPPASRPAPAADSGAARADEGFWVAVLPFKYGGTDASLTALAEGLTEEIVTGLSRFSYLRVISRSATVDSRSAGKQVGARYVMEGSLRQAGTKLRLAVQLVDAASSAHLWAENFERTFSPETIFDLQDDLVPRIVSTVADMYGVLSRSMSEALRGKADEELSPHEAVLSAFGYMERVTPEEHARVRRILERAVSTAPNQSDAWAMLANLYWEEHAHGLNPQPDPLGRALAASRRAVEAAPSNNLAHYALASTLFFQKDFLAFRLAAERAIELNRMDASVAAYIGNLIAYTGDWERGCALVESAMQLNPHHPGWYWFVNFNDAYRRRDYRGALDCALKINLPGNFYTHAVIAMAYGQLGMREAAGKALQELLAIRPDFAETAREEFGRWFHDLAFNEHMIDGLRKAGLDVP
jgi:TolB-like protein/Tfp pilus assembly protein PilF